jgi:hypothetical protein
MELNNETEKTYMEEIYFGSLKMNLTLRNINWGNYPPHVFMASCSI